MVKTPRFHCRGHGFDLCSRGTKILYAAWSGQKKKKKKEFVPGQMGSAGMTGCGWASGSSGMPGRGSIC